MSELSDKECVPCKGGIPPLKGADLSSLGEQLGEDWQIIEEHHLEKTFQFPDFKEALAFTNRVGEFAETINHHPDLLLSWGQCKVTIWTHKIGGLAENDFIFAAKVNRLL